MFCLILIDKLVYTSLVWFLTTSEDSGEDMKTTNLSYVVGSRYPLVSFLGGKGKMLI